MNIEQITQFLIEAESKTYLAGEEGDIFKVEFSISLPREIVYEYSRLNINTPKPKLRYIDRYFGREKFSGQEMIFQDYDVPVWGRSYYGITSPTSDYTKEMILDSVRKGRARFISDLWNGAAELQSFVSDDLVFVIRFSNPNNASFESFLYHEWIFFIHKDEEEKEALFHRICAGGVID
ncbi:MAG: DUF5680 domain-containing protein [Patescibacteria group bacterium]|nr:DUF5680 domain-containing protein [Patescibacteria group bacterium]